MKTASQRDLEINDLSLKEREEINVFLKKKVYLGDFERERKREREKESERESRKVGGERTKQQERGEVKTKGKRKSFSDL